MFKSRIGVNCQLKRPKKNLTILSSFLVIMDHDDASLFSPVLYSTFNLIVRGIAPESRAVQWQLYDLGREIRARTSFQL